MLRFLSFLSICLVLFSCSNTEETDETTTGIVMEVEPTQNELDQVALQSQPNVIQDFFEVNNSIIGDDFCFDPTAVRQLILHGNDSTHSWSKFEASDYYLTIYQEECEVILEFMTFYLGNEKRAFLSQMNTSIQTFHCLLWDTEKSTWVKMSDYPKPALKDYFSNLNESEIQMVDDYGSDFIYIDPKNKSARFMFSAWAMRMNMGEKEMLEFNKETTSEFELNTSTGSFSLDRISMYTSVENTPTYFVAYHIEEDPSTSFKSQYASIIMGISKPALNHQLIQYGSNDFEVFFPTDTFSFSYMEQFEPRDGFWFYTPGKEPMDLGADENIITLIDQAKAYYTNK